MIRPMLLVIMITVSASCGFFRPETSGGIINVTLTADGDINPNISGEAAPLRIMLFSLTDTEFFTESNYFDFTGRRQGSLQNGITKLYDGVLTPGETRKLSLHITEQVAAIGVIGGYREIEHARWKSSVKLSPGWKPTVWRRLILPQHNAFYAHFQKSELTIGETE